jgi:excisionase family DNA binding protein
MTGQDEPFVSFRQFAERTSLSLRTISRMAADGRIPTIAVGRRRLIAYPKALAALQASSDTDGQSVARRSERDPTDTDLDGTRAPRVTC